MRFPGIKNILRLPIADSTQSTARALAEAGDPAGTLVWADRQTAGRGRLQRQWDSGAGGLYFSLILRPACPPSRLAELSLMAAKASAEALSTTGITAMVKPPNDVIGSQGRLSGKICGILAEASGDSRRVDWLILGVGINVNNNVGKIPGAVSLKQLTRRSWGRSRILRLFLENFFRAHLLTQEIIV